MASEPLETSPGPAGGRPPRGLRRVARAYWVTYQVVLSYLWWRFFARLRSADGAMRSLKATHLRNARRIERAISRLQGLYIKVGQLISIMTNFLPDEFRRQLTRLQDRVPPRPYADVDRRFREEFAGRGPLDVFAEFSPEPIASASIGQVHAAVTRDGARVAVKVQYPDIDEIVRLDLRALRRIFRIVHWFAPYHGLLDVFEEIRLMVLQELDLKLEAASIQRIADNFRARAAAHSDRPPEAAPPTDGSNPGGPESAPDSARPDSAPPGELLDRIPAATAAGLRVAFPKVRLDLSTARVLTTGWVGGVKVNDSEGLASLGIDRSQLTRAIVTAYCQQIFTDGLYHADPHPGNLLLRRVGDGPAELVFLDFGAVAEVSPRMRSGIVEMIQAGLSRDTARLVRAMRDMGFVARGADMDIFERVIDYLHDKFHEEVKLDTLSLRDVRFDPEKALENLADLRRMNVSLRDLADHFHIPKEWIMLERTVLLLLGLCTELDPGLNPMQVIRPYLEEFVLGQDRDWSKLVVDTTKEVAAMALALPGELRKFLVRAQRGQLEVRFGGLEDNARLLYTLGHQLIYTACGLVLLTLAVHFDSLGQPGRAEGAAIGAGLAFLRLFLSMLATRSRLNRRRR